MRLEKVKINPHNRVEILCSYCDMLKHENETYADLDTRFRYICHKCAMDMMLIDGKNLELNYETN
jgi:Zn finger protein HypA/HybF involved in hydrogenase expression